MISCQITTLKVLLVSNGNPNCLAKLAQTRTVSKSVPAQRRELCVIQECRLCGFVM
jgi:hypothetical protein